MYSVEFSPGQEAGSRGFDNPAQQPPTADVPADYSLAHGADSLFTHDQPERKEEAHASIGDVVDVTTDHDIVTPAPESVQVEAPVFPVTEPEPSHLDAPHQPLVDTDPSNTYLVAESDYTMQREDPGTDETDKPVPVRADNEEEVGEDDVLQPIPPEPNDDAEAGGDTELAKEEKEVPADAADGADGPPPPPEVRDTVYEEDPFERISLANAIAERQLHEQDLDKRLFGDTVLSDETRSPLIQGLRIGRSAAILQLLEDPDAEITVESITSPVFSDDAIIALDNMGFPDSMDIGLAPDSEMKAEYLASLKNNLKGSLDDVLRGLVETGLYKEEIQEFRELLPQVRAVADERGLSMADVFRPESDYLYREAERRTYGTPEDYIHSRLQALDVDRLYTRTMVGLEGRRLMQYRLNDDTRDTAVLLQEIHEDPSLRVGARTTLTALRGQYLLETAARVNRIWPDTPLTELPPALHNVFTGSEVPDPNPTSERTMINYDEKLLDGAIQDLRDIRDASRERIQQITSLDDLNEFLQFGGVAQNLDTLAIYGHRGVVRTDTVAGTQAVIDTKSGYVSGQIRNIPEPDVPQTVDDVHVQVANLPIGAIRPDSMKVPYTLVRIDGGGFQAVPTAASAGPANYQIFARSLQSFLRAMMR